MCQGKGWGHIRDSSPLVPILNSATYCNWGLKCLWWRGHLVQTTTQFNKSISWEHYTEHIRKVTLVYSQRRKEKNHLMWRLFWFGRFSWPNSVRAWHGGQELRVKCNKGSTEVCNVRIELMSLCPLEDLIIDSPFPVSWLSNRSNIGVIQHAFVLRIIAVCV